MKKVLLYLIIAGAVGFGLWWLLKPSYVPSEYGPIEFEMTLEGDQQLIDLGIPITDVSGNTEVEFTPEDAGIVREDIGALRLKDLTFTTDREDGFAAFSHITITFISDKTETIDVGSIKIEEGHTGELVVKGRESEGEVPEFKDIKKFRVLTQLNIRDGYTIEEPVQLNGKMMLNVMVEEKDGESKGEGQEKEEKSEE